MSGDRQEMGAYAPPPEDYSTFDARDDEGGRRGPILLIAIVAVFGLFAFVVWKAYNLGVRDRNDPPLIEAAGDYRQAPDDPGGFQTPDQDVDVYNLADSVASTGSEDTQPPATNDNEVDAEDPAEGEADSETQEVANQPPDLRIEADDRDALNDLVESISEGETPDNTADTATPDTDLVMPGPETTPDTTPQTTLETQLVPVTDTSLVQPATSGNFVVQIAAFRSQEEAEDGWLSFTGRFPGMAAGRTPDIVRVDLGDRGIYHRLRIAAFETRDQAAEFCSSLSDQGQDCLVASR